MGTFTGSVQCLAGLEPIPASPLLNCARSQAFSDQLEPLASPRAKEAHGLVLPIPTCDSGFT